MPTYVYGCSKCNKSYEIEQRITEDALKDCQCGGKGTMKRIIQPIAVAFKGAGFHINDYSPKSAPSEAKAGAPAAESCTGEPASCPACSPKAEPAKESA
jgi:putative FmdB family regulatory protein